MSVSASLVVLFLKHKEELLRKLKYTFCADEFLLLSLMELFPLQENSLIRNNHWLYVRFPPGSPNPAVVTASQVPQLLESPYLFARKFSIKEPKAIKRIERSLMFESEKKD